VSGRRASRWGWCVAAIGAALWLPAAAGANVSVGHSGWFWGNPLPQGNDIAALDFAAQRGFAVGAFGTVLRSDDAGRTWSGLSSGLTNDLATVDAVTSDTLIVAGGCALRRSDDGGLTFRRLPWTASEQRCQAGIAQVAFPSGNVGYLLLSNNRLRKTTDGGRTWSDPGVEGLPTPTDVTFTSETTGFATAGGGIFRTVDGARTWTRQASPAANMNAVSFPTAAAGYAVGSGGTIARTADGGTTWDVRTTVQDGPAPNLTDVRCGTAELCAVWDGSPSGARKLLRTVDAGVTFTPVDPFGGASLAAGGQTRLAVAFASATRVVAIGFGGVTVASDDGGATFARIGGAIADAFDFARVTSAQVYQVAGRAGRVAVTVDGGRTWTGVGVPVSRGLADLSFASATVGYVLDADGSLLRTDNGGSSWSALDTGTGGAASSLLAVSPDVVLITAGGTVRRSADGGVTFSAVSAKAVARGATRLERAGAAVVVHGSGLIAVSTDAGQRWQRVKAPAKRIVSVDFVSAKVGFATDRTGRLWSTLNGGRTWQPLDAVGASVDEVAFADRLNGYARGDCSPPLAASVGCLLRTSDGGRSWRPQVVSSQALKNVAIGSASSAVAIGYGGGWVFATTGSGDSAGDSSLTLKTPRRALDRATLKRQKGRVKLTGRLSPAASGASVTVAYRPAGRSWRYASAQVSRNGSFSATVAITGTTTFVASWPGDDVHAGAGTPALTVTVGR